MSKKSYIVIALLLFSGLFSSLFAQVSQTQYFMNLPQRNLGNPAFNHGSNVYVGIPVLSNTFISLNNNMLNFSEVFQTMPGSDSLMTPLHPDYNIDSFLDKMGKVGYISGDASTLLLGLGFTIANDWYVDIGLSQKGSVTGAVPRDLMTLLFKGNEEYVGSTIDLSGLGFRAMLYTEASVGLSKNINDKLRVGGRMKLLFGGVGASLETNRLDIDVANDFTHTLYTDMSLNISGPVDITTDENGFVDELQMWENISPFDILLNGSNKGVAFDLGAQYNIMDNLTLSASIIDLGLIGWKNEVYSFKATNEFSFDGFDLSEVIAGNLEFDEMIDAYADTLIDSFNFDEGADKFRFGLPTKIFLGANYKPVDIFGVGLLSRTLISQGHMSQAVSLSANLYLGNALSTSLSYTMANRSYNNFGFGLAVKGGPVQFYLIADQIPASWVRLESSSEMTSFAVPSRLDMMNLRFGINLVFGKSKQKAVDKPMLLE